ncbi:galactoside 2-alpha-L-fucosyltransferase-like protein [Carex littledalei]|uniref:Fucosyltransferase n=1 Tax=Carex littledalei TaxID=544730 RepID=A0A833QZU0_9POAL|nr:galactoside 2-alpha-L-fucosyltransferase-like protein [Carex littledalei]
MITVTLLSFLPYKLNLICNFIKGKQREPIEEGGFEMKKRWSFMAMIRPLFVVLLVTAMACLVLLSSNPQSAPPARASSQTETDGYYKHDGVSNQSTTSRSEDMLLGSLLSPDLDEHSCMSRYQSGLYRKTSPHNPSTYLVSKLRNYEALHKRCGPNTLLYNKSVEQLRTNHSTDQLECNYVIWTPLGGLGNRMLTLASTFLYALLTGRVLLVDHATDFVDLFCEPFPGSSWVLPSNFPIESLNSFDVDSKMSYGYLMKHNLISEDPKTWSEMLPSFVYVHLESTYIWDMYHQLFFCDDSHFVLSKINWLLLKSDNYFLPGLFMLSTFENELSRMFPSRETVFHHLSRYLFQPGNSVWELAMKYYHSYVAMANQTVGIQIRDFPWSLMSKEDRFNQIMDCTLKENILPHVTQHSRKTTYLNTDEMGSKAILVISLYKDYYDRMKSYYARSTHVGQHVNVYQPSHEEAQQLKNQSHNEKALAEIVLLSFSDVLVTSAWSTFGYVSYNFAGVKPWILLSSKVSKEVHPPCRRVTTMDPCFHTPPSINCKTKRRSKTKLTGAHIKQCEDVEEGIKLVD